MRSAIKTNWMCHIMINDTPRKTDNTRTTKAKPASKSTYDGGFHAAASNQPFKNTASKRGTCQSFTFAR